MDTQMNPQSLRLSVWLRCAAALAAVLPAVRVARADSPSLDNAFAKLQRDGKPYPAFYNHYVAPHAWGEKGKIFTAHQDGNGRPIVMAYDVAAKTWAGPVRASRLGLGADTHGNPSLCIDGKGYLHLFFGCHGRAMRHVRSKRPCDIREWAEAASPAPRATYPESMRMADGRIFLFYRAGGHMEPWSLTTSEDDGTTWSKAQKIVEMRIAPKDRKAAAYCAFLPGAHGKTVHCFFVYKDDNPRGNKRKYLGLHEAVYRYHVYYIFRDAKGKWLGADGSALKLPLSKADADKHARILDTGELFAGHRRILIGKDDRPYLHFSVGVRDWKTHKTIVPLKMKYASVRDGKWTIADKPGDDWPENIRRLIAKSGAPVYGGEIPSPWYIRFQAGPKDDRTATYIWLGHIEKGYAARKGGPAPPPKD